jgi:hypothetical protein
MTWSLRVALVVFVGATVVPPSAAAAGCETRRGEKTLIGNKQVRVLVNRRTQAVTGCFRRSGRRTTLIKGYGDTQWDGARRLYGSLLVYKTYYESGAPGDRGSSLEAVDLRTGRKSLLGYTSYDVGLVVEQLVLTRKGRIAALRRFYAPADEYREVVICRVGSRCGGDATVEKGTHIVPGSLRRRSKWACWDVVEEAARSARCARLVR